MNQMKRLMLLGVVAVVACARRQVLEWKILSLPLRRPLSCGGRAGSPGEAL